MSPVVREPRHYIVSDGKDVPCDLDVIDGREHGMWWRATDTGAYLRRLRLRAVLLHHTGGEGPPERVYSTLWNRRLSIHFVIDQMGRVTQMADVTRTATQHAGRMNGASVGVEIVSRGHGQPLPGHWRHPYVDTVHGHEVRFMRLFDAQIDAAEKLSRWLCEHIGVPFQFPLDQRGRVRRGFLGTDALDTFEGVMAHYHCSESKVDVDPHTMDVLAQRAEQHP